MGAFGEVGGTDIELGIHSLWIVVSRGSRVGVSVQPSRSLVILSFVLPPAESWNLDRFGVGGEARGGEEGAGRVDNRVGEEGTSRKERRARDRAEEGKDKTFDKTRHLDARNLQSQDRARKEEGTRKIAQPLSPLPHPVARWVLGEFVLLVPHAELFQI